MEKIKTNELATKIKAKESLNIIDVRGDDEVALGKIPGAVHVPLTQIPERLADLNQEQDYYIICASGGRSGMACEFLTEEGFSAVNVVGGMNDWEGELE